MTTAISRTTKEQPMSLISRLLARLFRVENLRRTDGEVYMRRFVLLRLKSGRGIYLHNFLRNDDRRDPHDHTGRFISIGLKGGYVEDKGLSFIWEGQLGFEGYCERFTAPWIRTFPPNHIHIISLRPRQTCWTLIFHGKYVRPWGFTTNRGWVHWQEYLDEEDWYTK